MNYEPIGEENWNRLVTLLKNIQSHLPENDAPFIWNMYNDTRGMKERQPCTCGSSGKYWGEAIQHLRQWVNERTINQ